MCVVSNVGDFYSRRWPEQYPWIQPGTGTVTTGVSREEFEALRREVERMVELLKMAKQIDEEIEQAECETEDKVALLRKVAEIFGISLEDVL